MSHKNSLTYYTILIMLFVVPLMYFKTYIGPIPVSVEVISIPILVLIFLWDYINGRLQFNTLPIKWFAIAFAAFFIIAVISMVKAVSYGPAVMELARYLSYVFLFFIVAKVDFTKKQYKNFAISFLLAALIVGLFGVLQYVFNYSLNKAGLYALKEAKGRVDSTLINPNYYASYLNIVIPTLFLLAVVYFKNKTAQLLMFAFYGIYVINVILTYTRSAWMTMACGLVLIIIIMPKTFVKKFFKPHVLIAFVVLAVVVYFLPDVQSRTNSAIYAMEELVFKKHATHHNAGDGTDVENNDEQEQTPEDATTNKAVVSRVTLWKTGWYMFKDNPVLGVGMGNYYVRYKDFTEKYPELDIGYDKYSVHNSYLKVAAETGIFGILAFLFIYIVYYLKIAALYFRQDTLGKVIAAGLFVGGATFMVQNLSNNLIFIPQLNVIFWILAAVGVGFLHKNQEQF
ncbi:O-antigen ligase family protein [Falsibacillus albus]|uniref:O-antigen ligase family protein n=1 Tax=Falsibacillus albus TaxID=2478915 RepID=A0A3L7K3D7_9BACI|nr:O-antigen ligase family protein [Falsibacillus albus]RLQ96824.1 O-antigen ligase family protein [Falsibacillus albus]